MDFGVESMESTALEVFVAEKLELDSEMEAAVKYSGQDDKVADLPAGCWAAVDVLLMDKWKTVEVQLEEVY